LAAVMSLVPIFGSILSSLPIVAVALTGGLSTGVGTLLWIIGVHPSIKVMRGVATLFFEFDIYIKHITASDMNILFVWLSSR
jgi:hypothetical protein